MSDACHRLGPLNSTALGPGQEGLRTRTVLWLVGLCCPPSLTLSSVSEQRRAKELVCVPVDVTDSLRCFRETMEKSKYHNRSVRHSRKLLSLFLAQTQGKGLSLVPWSALTWGTTLQNVLASQSPPRNMPSPISRRRSHHLSHTLYSS